jgi:hypothetical protein
MAWSIEQNHSETATHAAILTPVEIQVFHYRFWDIRHDTYVIPNLKATRQFIEMAKGEIIEESAQTVDESRVDGNGLEEVVCADNGDILNEGLEPIPTSDKPDF